MKNTNKRLSKLTGSKLSLYLFVAVGALSFSSIALSEYVPFPGKHKVRLVSVDAANIVSVNFETWPGYGRTLRVTLPDLVLPGESSEAKPCELELAKKALALTKKHMKAAKEISITDMAMQTSADTDVVTAVYTDKGRLGQVLKKKGYARAPSVDPKTPWCK